MAENRWEGWQFLIGEWVGEGGGEPGEGSANFSFLPDLQENILVRRNHVDYPPTAKGPAWFHADLLIVYLNPDQTTRSIYFDNEGHVIQYTVEVAKENGLILFVSEAVPVAPRFRLSYQLLPDETLSIGFEIAPPGHPENFSMYTQGTARRK